MLTGILTWPLRYRPRESMLSFTYTAFLPDPESPSPPQADNRMKIIAMIKWRGFNFWVGSGGWCRWRVLTKNRVFLQIIYGFGLHDLAVDFIRVSETDKTL